LDVQVLRRLRKVQKQRGAEPAFQGQLLRVVPIPAGLFSPPFKAILVPWERRQREDQREAILGIRDISNHPIDHGVGTGNVYKALGRRRATGETTARRGRVGRKPKLAAHDEALRVYVVEHCDATIEEIQAWLLAERKVKVSVGCLMVRVIFLGTPGGRPRPIVGASPFPNYQKLRNAWPAASAALQWFCPALQGILKDVALPWSDNTYVTARRTQGEVRVKKNLTTNLKRLPLLLFRRRSAHFAGQFLECFIGRNSSLG
jgi:hypothetical protein